MLTSSDYRLKLSFRYSRVLAAALLCAVAVLGSASPRRQVSGAYNPAAGSRDLVDVKATISTEIARNPSELADLRKKGERDFFEFDIRKDTETPLIHVADIQLALESAYPKQGKFDLVIRVDENKLEKTSQSANVPIQFLVGRDKLRYEVVVNFIDIDRIRGYVSTPNQSILAVQRAPREAPVVLRQAQADAENAAMSGIVRNASTGAPLPEVQVTAIRIANASNPPAPGSARRTPPVTTDSAGHFEIRGLSAGSYRVYAVRAGYGAEEYGQRLPNHAGTPVVVGGGQANIAIEFRLPPAAVVSGRVTDVSGNALARVEVHLQVPTYDAMGKRSLKTMAHATTDDRGEYRIFWILPGSYYASAAVPESSAQALAVAEGLVGTGTGAIANAVNQTVGAEVATTPPSPKGVATTYYPGTADPSKAAPLNLAPGAFVPLDFKLLPERAGRIAGRVIDAANGQPPRAATITLDPEPGSGYTPKAATNYRPDTGAFEIEDVAPGSYTLRAISSQGLLGALSAVLDSGQRGAPAGARGQTTPKSASTHIAVDATVVNNIILKLSETLSIKGQLVLDGGAALSTLPNLDQIRVRFIDAAVARLAQNNVPAAARVVGPGQPRIGQDGSFTVQALPNCSCVLTVLGLPPNSYVKSLRFASVDIKGNLVPVPESIPGPIEITVATNGGLLEGTLAGSAPLKGVEAVLVPADPTRQDLYRVVEGDVSGRFTLQGIAPGDYKLFAWQDIEPNGYRNADFLKAYESQGQTIHIEPSANVTARVNVIP